MARLLGSGRGRNLYYPRCLGGDARRRFVYLAGHARLQPMVDRLDALYTVMTSDVAFQRLRPANELLRDCWHAFDRAGGVPDSPCFAAAEVGRQYVVYKENGGQFALDLAAGTYAAT